MEKSLCLGAFVLDVGIPEEGFVKGQSQVLDGIGEGKGSVVNCEVGVVEIVPGLPTRVSKKTFCFLRIVG